MRIIRCSKFPLDDFVIVNQHVFSHGLELKCLPYVCCDSCKCHLSSFNKLKKSICWFLVDMVSDFSLRSDFSCMFQMLLFQFVFVLVVIDSSD